MRAQARAQHPQLPEECGHPTGAEQPTVWTHLLPGRTLRSGKKAPEGLLACEFCVLPALSSSGVLQQMEAVGWMTWDAPGCGDKNDPCGQGKLPITLPVGAQGWGLAQSRGAQGSTVMPRTCWERIMLWCLHPRTWNYSSMSSAGCSEWDPLQSQQCTSLCARWLQEGHATLPFPS